MAQPEVTAILRAATYNWTDLESPAPKATNKACLTESDQAVADRLGNWVLTQAGTLPWPYGVNSLADMIKWVRYEFFATRCKYWELNTSVALGQQSEEPVPHAAEAKTVDQWRTNLLNNVDRQGYPLYDLNDANSLAEKAQREAIAAGPCPSFWLKQADAESYQLGILTRYFPVPLGGFYDFYNPIQPFLNDCRGLTAQQYLDNLRARDKGMPLPWLPTPENPGVPS